MDASFGVRYPLVRDAEPVFVVGESKPRFYVHDETKRQIPTPDYDTWTGDWARKEL